MAVVVEISTAIAAVARPLLSVQETHTTRDTVAVSTERIVPTTAALTTAVTTAGVANSVSTAAVATQQQQSHRHHSKFVV